MADFIDISKWIDKPFYSTGGTRNKIIVENPINDSLYYFKTSLKKEVLDYKSEFWSEIIASEVGQSLGFNMLRYDIAHNNGEVGCISKSMTTEGKNKLTEGVSYLTGYDTTYNPVDKQSHKEYSFQLIKDALLFFNAKENINQLIKVIIFDSLIGNSDRHQENWGFITEYNELIKEIETFVKDENNTFGRNLFIFLVSLLTRIKRKVFKQVVGKLHLFIPGQFSQIYDSGSSLGRELSDEKIELMLKDQNMIDAYINRGKAEIHWVNQKLNHFELISRIKQEYPDVVSNTIKMVNSNYNSETVRKIVMNIDSKLPASLINHILPMQRKKFIIKLLHLRYNVLINKFIN